MIKISIIICTYNNTKGLEQTLISIVNQSLEKKLYEILVVDNNSTDETVALVKSFQLKLSLPEIRLISEKEQGLGFARNRGLKSARGKYVAFIDDDAQADKIWLEEAVYIMDNEKISPLACGGIILPLYQDRRPEWFKDTYETRSWGEKERFLKRDESFSGSNMIFPKRTILKYGGFDERVGMKGNYLSVGEETSLFEKIWQNKKVTNIFYYSSKLKVYHLVPAFKMTIGYQLKRSFAAGYAKFLRLDQLNLVKRFVHLLFYSLVMFFSVITAFLSLIKYRRYQNWLAERWSPVFYSLGLVYGILGFPVTLKR